MIILILFATVTSICLIAHFIGCEVAKKQRYEQYNRDLQKNR